MLNLYCIYKNKILLLSLTPIVETKHLHCVTVVSPFQDWSQPVRADLSCLKSLK